MKKYLIIGLSALIIEVCSTFYIRSAAEGDLLMMLFFATIGPFLGLPFIGYMVESKTWGERIKKAILNLMIEKRNEYNIKIDKLFEDFSLALLIKFYSLDIPENNKLIKKFSIDF